MTQLRIKQITPKDFMARDAYRQAWDQYTMAYAFRSAQNLKEAADVMNAVMQFTAPNPKHPESIAFFESLPGFNTYWASVRRVSE